MYLEIEFEAENFIKFSLEFLRFFSALIYFSCFFYDFWLFFKSAHFRSTESVGASLVNSTQIVLKTHSFIFKLILMPFSTFLSYFSQIFTPKLSKILSILLPSLLSLPKSLNPSKIKSPKFFFETLIAQNFKRSTISSHGFFQGWF